MNNKYPYNYNTNKYPEPVEGLPVDNFSDQMQNVQTQPIEGIPLKYPIYEENAYQNSKWNDLFFLFLFAAQLITVVVLGGKNMSSYSLSFTNSTSENSKFSTYVATSLCISIGLGYLILALMRYAPESFIRWANYILIIFNFVATILCFAKGLIGLAIMFMLQFMIIGYWFYISQVYIPFTTMLLKTSVGIMSDNKSIFLVPIICLAFMVIYSVFLLYAIIPSINQLYNNESVGYLILLFVLLFFWTQQIVSNVIHVTSAGMVGKWYHKNQDNSNIVWKSFGRAITKSFGSVCFGSLVVAIIKTIQFIVRMVRRDDNSCIMCCADCLISFLERIVEYFNEYAYAYVGIYGTSYIDSAKRTWELAKTHFITALFNDNLLYPVLLFSNLFIGFFTGLFCWIIMQNFATALICSIVGFATASIITNLVHNTIVALFVCCIEDFNKLNEIVPDLFNIINVTHIELRSVNGNGQNQNNRYESEI
jgi:hypothetical protein